MPFGLVIVVLTTSWASQAFLPAGQIPAISATPTASGTPVPPKPTSMPGPPALISPEKFAQLLQPVPPDQWEFVWEAREGPCFCTLTVDGPQDFRFSATVWPAQGYHYTYTRAEPLPDDALMPWYWFVRVTCPLGSNISEAYGFSVSPAVWPPASTPTPTPIPTPTGTPTGIPGLPTLIAPLEGARWPSQFRPANGFSPGLPAPGPVIPG